MRRVRTALLAPIAPTTPTARTGPAAALAAVAATAILLAACGGSGSHPKTSSTTSTRPGPTPTTAHRPTPRPESSPILTQVNVHYPLASAADQTAPTVSPRTGGLTTVFTLHVHVHSRLGAHGYSRLSYRVLLKGIRPRCAVFTLLDAGTDGSVADIELHPPIELGWCRGAYEGEVLLETDPSCPPRTSASDTTPCPSFATRYAVVGRFTFLAH